MPANNYLTDPRGFDNCRATLSNIKRYRNCVECALRNTVGRASGGMPGVGELLPVSTHASFQCNQNRTYARSLRRNLQTPFCVSPTLGPNSLVISQFSVPLRVINPSGPYQIAGVRSKLCLIGSLASPETGTNHKKRCYRQADIERGIIIKFVCCCNEVQNGKPKDCL